MGDPTVRWTLYYVDSAVSGETLREWLAAPDDGVQALVVWEPYPDGRRPWRGVSDRQVWTGEEKYQLFNWPAKRGSLISDAAYEEVWRRAFYEPEHA